MCKLVTLQRENKLSGSSIGSLTSIGSDKKKSIFEMAVKSHTLHYLQIPGQNYLFLLEKKIGQKFKNPSNFKDTQVRFKSLLLGLN